MKCEQCPVSGICLGETTHPYFCDDARTGDPTLIQMIKQRSEMQEYPSIFQQAINLGKATAKFLASGLRRATPEQQANRLAICRECDRYDADEVRCRECGCYLQEKTSWASESCPLTPPKWSAVVPAAGKEQGNERKLCCGDK